MTNKHLILSNRVVDMSYKKIDNSSFELVDELEIEIQQIINENLLKRPTSTINFLKSVAKKLKTSSDYLLNEVSIPIQKKLSNKIELSDIEKFNFEEAGELGIKIDEIIDNIINNIGAVSTITKQEPQPKFEVLAIDTEINDKWKTYVLNGGKLNQPEIALLCFYEGIVIPKPNKESTIAENIALWHGHKSGSHLYNLYDEISDRTNRLTNRTAKTMCKYLENIMPLISSTNLGSIEKDLLELSDK